MDKKQSNPLLKVKKGSKIAEHAPLSERGGLHANQVEEQEHIPLWSSFSKELGILPAELATYKGLPKTKEAVAKLQGICNGFAEGASAMYAFEKPLPDISTTKLEGIKSFYNMESKAATTYFEVHAVVDVVHAEHWASVLKKQDKNLEKPSLLVLKSLWLLSTCCLTVATRRIVSF